MRFFHGLECTVCCFWDTKELAVWTDPNRQNMANVQTKTQTKDSVSLWRDKHGACVVYLVFVLHAYFYKHTWTTWVIKPLPSCSAIICEETVCPYSWQKAISGLGIMTAWFRPQRLKIIHKASVFCIGIVDTDLSDFNQIRFGRWWGFLRLYRRQE